MSAREIVAARGGDWCGRFGLMPGPGHSRRDRSLKVWDADDGRVLVHSFAGDAWQECRKHLGLDDDGWQQRPTQAPKPKRRDPDTRNRDRALSIWRETRPAPGTFTDIWLAGRGIRFAIPAGIRHHDALEYREGDTVVGRYPAMVVRLDDADGNLIGIHRTFLNAEISPNPVRKAPVPTPRKALGRMGVAWLGRRDVDAIIVGEGVETVLAASELTDGSDDPPEPYVVTPVACICAAGIARFDPPATVQRIYIAADDDDAGRRAAASLADRAAARGISVFVIEETGR